METSKLKNIAWAVFALILSTSSVFAQGRGYGNRNFNQEKRTCLNIISGLSEKQQTQISEMENAHQVGMAELRTKRRATTNAVEKSEIRTEMLKKVEAHRAAVRKILNKEQQTQYDQLQQGNYGNKRNQRGNFARGNGNRQCINSQPRGRNANYNCGNTQRKGNRENQGRGNGQRLRNSSCVNNLN